MIFDGEVLHHVERVNDDIAALRHPGRDNPHYMYSMHHHAPDTNRKELRTLRLWHPLYNTPKNVIYGLSVVDPDPNWIHIGKKKDKLEAKGTRLKIKIPQ